MAAAHYSQNRSKNYRINTAKPFMSSKISREKARISDVESFSIKKACVGVTMNKYDNNMFLRIKKIAFYYDIS